MIEAVPTPEKDIHQGKIFIFVGLEGSGKTTQAKLLAGKLGKQYISTGDMIRERAANDPEELGERCRGILSGHGYLEANHLLSLLGDRLSRDDTAKGAVLDGALRTLDEVNGFQDMLEKAGREQNQIVVVSLRSPAWETSERLIKRGRTDDTPEATLSRFKEYYRDLGKRMGIVRRNWDFVQVSSRGINGGPKSKQEEIDKVQERIWEAITR